MIVYLDQNAISELAINRRQCPDLERLRKTLKKGHHEGLLICPVPPETVLETIGIGAKEDRLAVYRLQCELASNEGQTFAFKAFNKLVNQGSLAMIRGQSQPSRFESCVWHSVDEELLVQQHRPNIEKAKNMWRDGFTKVGKTLGNCCLNVENASHGIRSEHAVHVIRQIERLEMGLPPAREDEIHLAYDLIKYLISQNVSAEELAWLKQAVIDCRWEAIPVVFYRAAIAAELEVRYRSPRGAMTYDPNNEIDISRMAVAMNSASVVITENAMAGYFNSVTRRIHQKHKKTRDEDWLNVRAFRIGAPREASDYIEQALTRQ